MSNIQMLDCTLRDGAYIVNGKFGEASIRGLIKKLADARIDIIECGWFKDAAHDIDSTYMHVPSDLCKYLDEKEKDKNIIYAAMIDWDRYDFKDLKDNDGKGIDLFRVVFPKGKVKNAVEVGKKVLAKGYRLYFQAANTLGYNDDEINELCECINKSGAEALYMVDTFGAMFLDDAKKIAEKIDNKLDKNISLGFHTHNNMQMAFANGIMFIETMQNKNKNRDLILDSSLMGMGRGAGNATTELVSNYLNNKYNKHYNFDAIMDAIDTYMTYYKENFQWGYSTPYFIAGMYCTHVNNIAYLLDNHATSARDMRNIIESMDAKDRVKYDYDLLESKYIANQSKKVDDKESVDKLLQELNGRKILLLAPGRSIIDEKDKINQFIKDNNAYVIAVNAIIEDYEKVFDRVFFINPHRYTFAKETYNKDFANIKKITLSNIVNTGDNNELIINYERAVKKGYLHFDNAVISLLRLLDNIGVKEVSIAGFDGFKNKYNESYANPQLPSLNLENKWDELNIEIKDMMKDFKDRSKNLKNINFITESIFNV